jgi:CubicO group peptidase (beta-lactamase class C family)
MGTKTRVLVATLGALTLAVAGAWVSNPVYWSRYLAVAAKGGSGDVDSYSPTEPVAGDHDGFLPVAPGAERTVPAEALAAAREYAARNRSSSLLVWHRGRLQSADYWGGDAATPVNSRSLHKMLGGLLIGAAIHDGHIASLDDPVAKYLTEWQGTPKAAITIRNLLQMSSGLMWFRGGGAYSIPSRRYLDPHWDRVLLDEVPLEFEPGSAWDYSDITADVMPHLIERATGQRYAKYLGDAILKPLHAPGGRIWVNREGGLPHGGCCLMLPPEAWLRIGVMTLNGGRSGEREILPPWWLDEMRKPSPNNPHFGLMVWLGQPYTQRRLFHRPDSPSNANPRPGAFHSEPYLADDLFLFDGMNGQIVYLVPSQQLVIVRTGLRPPAGQPEWDNSVLPNLVLRALQRGAVAARTLAQPDPAPPAATAAARPSAPAPALVTSPARPSAPAQPPARDRTLGERLAGERRFWSRWRSMSSQTPVTLPAWLDVTEKVRGDFHGELPSRPAAERSIPAASLAAAEAYAAKTQSLSLLVWHDGAIEYEKYWDGRSPDDVSETYSMAKSVLGLAIGRAIADGAIGSVDDAVAKYIAEWRGTAKETLTIRQLLQMSSGLQHERFNYSFRQSPWAIGLRTFLGPDIETGVLGFGIRRVPGAEFNYNSANTQLLLAVLQRATGRRYADFVSERLWQPLGAKDATLWLDRPGGTPRAFSYFVARPRDWLRIGVMIAQRGRFDDREILPAAWIEAMTTPSPRNPNYGFQAWLGSPASGKRIYNRNTAVSVRHSAPYLANDVVFFDGGGGHRVYVVPSRRLVIVRTGSVNRPDWDDAILPNAILQGLPAMDSPAKQPAAMAQTDRVASP